MKLRNVRGILGNVWRHPANQGHRATALVRSASFEIEARVAHRTRVISVGKSRLIADVEHYASVRALQGWPPDWDEMQAWRRLLTPGDLFVDIGANVGTYSLWAAEAGAEVIAVEPGLSALTALRKNLALNDYPIEVLPIAVADRPGTMTMIGSDVLKRLAIAEDSATGDEQVEVSTLDTVLGARVAAGVKIDVEGAELLVLQGAEQALSEHRIRALQLEWNDCSLAVLGQSREPVAELLAKHGYRLFRPDMAGRLEPLPEVPGFGLDVFALPSD